MNKLLDIWSSRPSIDWLLAAVAIPIYELIPDGGPIGELASSSRTVFYETLAGISGALLGFAIAAVAILLGLGSGPRLEFVKKTKWAPQIAKTFTGAVRALAVTTLVFVLALLFDAGETPIRMWAFLIVAAGVLAAARTVRATWLLNNLVQLAYEDSRPAANA